MAGAVQSVRDNATAIAVVARLLSELKRETTLMSALVVKHNNQHRRALYWRAFRRWHRLTLKVADTILHPLVRQGNAASLGACSSAARRCSRAVSTGIPLCAAISAPHTGAGFAGLAAVILASSAQYMDLLRRAHAVLEGGWAGQGGEAATPSLDGPGADSIRSTNADSAAHAAGALRGGSQLKPIGKSKAAGSTGALFEIDRAPAVESHGVGFKRTQEDSDRGREKRPRV